MQKSTQIHELMNAHDFDGAFTIALELYKHANNSTEKRYVIKPALLTGHVKLGLSVLKEVIEHDRDIKRLSDTDLALMGAITAITVDSDVSKSYFEQILSTEPKYTSDITLPIALSYLFAEEYQWKDIRNKSKMKLKRQSTKNVGIAKYLLNEIDENEFLQNESNNDVLATRELCKKYYYVSRKARLDGDKEKEIEFRKKCIETEGRFLEIEYFIAQIELNVDHSEEMIQQSEKKQPNRQ